MKRNEVIRLTFTTTFILFLSIFSMIAQKVAINEDGSSAHESAILHVKSATKGMLIPQMTSSQRSLIVAPATGLLVFDSDTESFWFKETVGWVELVDGNVRFISDDDQDTKIEVENLVDEDTIRMSVAGYEQAKLDGKTFHLGAPGKNTFIGINAGEQDNGSNNRNTALGYNALRMNQYGIHNSAFGTNALKNNEAETNSAFGFESMEENQYGYSNSAFGANTLNKNDGNYNSAFGTSALQNTTSGSSNSAFGYLALGNNTTGEFNVAIGRQAQANLETGIGNITLGYQADQYNVGGEYNVIIGYKAGKNNTGHSKSRNIMIGYQAGYFNNEDERLIIENSSSSTPLIYGEFDNDFLRFNADTEVSSQKFTISNGTSPTLRFQDSSPGSNDAELRLDEDGNLHFYGGEDGTNAALQSQMMISADGYLGIGSTDPTHKLHVNAPPETDIARFQSNFNTKMQIHENGTLTVAYYDNNFADNYAIQLSNSVMDSVGSARAQSWATYSDQRIKSNVKDIQYGLNTIMKLKPKSYLFHSSEYNEGGLVRFKGKQTRQEIGFLAQDVHKLIPELVNKPKNEATDLWSMNYQKMTPVLVKGIQELAEENVALKDKLAQQEALLESITSRLENLEKNR